MTYVPVKCECGCVFWSATSHCPNCNAPVKPQARPIDANALVASLERSYKDLRELCDSIKEGEGAKEVYQGELITFLEAILRVREMPTIDYVPCQQWISVKDGLPEDCVDQSKDIRSIKVLVAIKAKNGWTVRTQTRQKHMYYRHFGSEPEVSWFWPHSAGEVVYWMSLPEIPKEADHA